MLLSVELTVYPMQKDHLQIIKAVIEKLHQFKQLDVETFPTATILIGDHGAVMAALDETISWSYETYGNCVFIAKFLPGYKAQY